MGTVLSSKFGATVDSYFEVTWQALGLSRLSFPLHTVALSEQREASQAQPLLVLQAENKGATPGADLPPPSSTPPSLWPTSHPTLLSHLPLDERPCRSPPLFPPEIKQWSPNSRLQNSVWISVSHQSPHLLFLNWSPKAQTSNMQRHWSSGLTFPWSCSHSKLCLCPSHLPLPVPQPAPSKVSQQDTSQLRRQNSICSKFFNVCESRGRSVGCEFFNKPWAHVLWG